MAIVVEDSIPALRPAELPQEEPKIEAKESKETKAAPVEPEDDSEDENGLTAAQRKELTDKMQRAVGKKHRQLREAEEFAADQYNNRRMAEGKVNQLEEQIATLKQQIEAAKPVDPEAGKPKRENFETDEAYNDAVIDYRVKKQLERDRLDALKKATEERQQQIVEAAKGRIAKASELVPDFSEVLESADAMVPPVIAGYMQESELIAELSYHFAKHPEELARVSKLTPARQLVEIGKIESKLQPFGPADGKPKAESKENDGAMPSPNDEESSTETSTRTSEARAPVIKPITSGSGSQVQTPEGKKSIREVIGDWEKRNGRNLHQRKRH